MTGNEVFYTEEVKVKKLHPDAVIPTYATPGSAGFDFVAIEDYTVNAQTTTLVKTGLSFAIPLGYEIQVRPRSGLSLKTKLRVANSPGTIDADFRGEVCIILTNSSAIPGNHIRIKKGDRIAQGVLCPVEKAAFVEVDDLPSTERGSGGLGSTGR